MILSRMLTLLAALLLSSGAAAAAPSNTVLRLEVKGAINPPISAYVRNGIAKAEEQGAQAVLIELDTPGGLLDSTREIIQAMLNSKLAIIVYTAPRGARATSAGAFIMMAADVAAMAPDTHIGAAHPVAIGGMPKLPEPDKKKDAGKKPASSDVMEEKAVSDAAAYIRTLAAQRGRNAQWAEKAVRESVSLTAKEALAQKVVDLVAEDRQELFRLQDGRAFIKNGKSITLKLQPVSVVEFEMGAFQRILHILANPNLAYLLLMIGLYGLIYEFSSPGVGFGAVVGIVCLTLAAYSLSILPVNYTGLLILGFGLILLMLETQIVSYGLLTIGGLILLVLGSLFLFDSPQPFLRVSLPLILGTTAATAAFFLLVVGKAWSAQRAQPAVGIETLIGVIGEARENLEPAGLVFVDGELWTAESKTPIPAGAKVVVREVRGRTLTVDKA